ncbi:MAG: 50S ribosomal protein L1 [Nanoarchaeota archaeon]|nr:50S ribosomal protein L1 [Nanoarchaeota archaeon]
MNKETLQKALKQLKETSQKRNFNQSYDLIINLKDLNLKNPDEQVDLYIPLHNSPGKKFKICALVGTELREEAQKVCDKMILVDDFSQYKDKKAIKKLAEEYNYFIAQANVMPKVAAAFGRVFGPKQKMPNPKAGCVVPPKTNLAPLYERLQKTVRAMAKTQLSMKLMIGNEAQKDEEVIDNIMTVYNALIHKLPKEEHNIRSVFLKLTMSKPVKIR